jgi:hypothetical protein
MAGTTYLAGSPDLSAYVFGANEFQRGDDVLLTVVIENSGINEYKYVQPTIIDSDDLPNTAKFLTATLLPGDAPVLIKTDRRMIGDLQGASSTTAVFTTKIDTNATSGTYYLPLLLNYSYLDTAERYAADTIKYTYRLENITIGLPITIKSEVVIDVLSAEAEHLNAGTEGYINLTFRNTGSDDGQKTVVKITRNGNSPVTPVDSSVYIGDFPAGSTFTCLYKVAVSDSAEQQTYPVNAVVEYENQEGDYVSSRSVTIGIPVGGKADFAIVSPPAEMHPGNRRTISVEYRNTGDITVYGAQARISAVDPFSSTEDIAYIGDLNPGESRTVNYAISVDRTATVKEYGLDSEIRYRDALDNTYISDIMKVSVDVTATKGIETILSNPIYLSVIAAAIIGIAYFLYQHRRKQQ